MSSFTPPRMEQKSLIVHPYLDQLLFWDIIGISNTSPYHVNVVVTLTIMKQVRWSQQPKKGATHYKKDNTTYFGTFQQSIISL
jgi:hypothetical protein